jgi:Glutamate-1-semialdehyde aminotransferase
VPIPRVEGVYNDIDGTAALIREQGSEIAAVIVEPMTGSRRLYSRRPTTSWRCCAPRRRPAGALLIFDEVMTCASPPGGYQARLAASPPT